jgi:hypothetical protein
MLTRAGMALNHLLMPLGLQNGLGESLHSGSREEKSTRRGENLCVAGWGERVKAEETRWHSWVTCSLPNLRLNLARLDFLTSLSPFGSALFGLCLFPRQKKIPN